MFTLYLPLSRQSFGHVRFFDGDVKASASRAAKEDERPLAFCQADIFGRASANALKRILPADNRAHEYVTSCGNYKKSARPRKPLFLDKKMDPVKKEVHILQGPVHLIAEDHARIMGSPCPCCRDKEKGEKAEIRTV